MQMNFKTSVLVLVTFVAPILLAVAACGSSIPATVPTSAPPTTVAPAAPVVWTLEKCQASSQADWALNCKQFGEVSPAQAQADAKVKAENEAKQAEAKAKAEVEAAAKATADKAAADKGAADKNATTAKPKAAPKGDPHCQTIANLKRPKSSGETQYWNMFCTGAPPPKPAPAPSYTPAPFAPGWNLERCAKLKEGSDLWLQKCYRG